MDESRRDQLPSVRALLELSWSQTLIVGHRGSASTHPENTLPAFEEAILCGADAVECDVHASSDGQLVVIHDHVLDWTTVLSGPVCERTLSELNSAGVPSFEDVLGLVQGRTVLIAEVKAGPEVARKVVQALQSRQMTEQAIVFSFDAESVQEAKRVHNDLYCVWLCGDDPGEEAQPLMERAYAAHADGLGLFYRHVREPLARELRGRGMPLFVWTVPPGLEMERLIGMGVNFVITDHPREAIQQLARS